MKCDVSHVEVDGRGCIRRVGRADHIFVPVVCIAHERAIFLIRESDETQRLRADMGYEGSVPASVGGLEGLPIGEPPEPALNWKREVDEDEGDCDDGDDCDDEDSYSYSMEDEDGE